VIVIQEGSIYHVGKIRITARRRRPKQKSVPPENERGRHLFAEQFVRTRKKSRTRTAAAAMWTCKSCRPAFRRVQAGSSALRHPGRRPAFVQRINIVGNTPPRIRSSAVSLIAPATFSKAPRRNDEEKRLDNLGYFEKSTFPETRGWPDERT